jgi:hypothetical protein
MARSGANARRRWTGWDHRPRISFPVLKKGGRFSETFSNSPVLGLRPARAVRGLDGEGTKAPKLYPVSAGHRRDDLVENGVDYLLYVTVEEVWLIG